MGIFKKKNTTSDIEVASLSNAAEEGNPEEMLALGLTAYEIGDFLKAQRVGISAQPN